MMGEIIRFELKYWRKSVLLYIFFLFNFFSIFLACIGDDISVGDDLGNININAPFALMNYAVLMSLFSVFITTTFANNAALKDFNVNFNPIIFTTPIRKRDFFFGRFISCVVISCIPLLGVLLAVLVSPYFYSGALDKTGPAYLGAFVNSFLLIILPNVILICSIIFSLATIFRNTTASFIGALLLLVGYLMSINYVTNLESEALGIYLDPFGISSLTIITKYWTLSQKNTEWLSFASPFMVNRLLWLTFGVVVCTLSYCKFSFRSKASKRNKSKILDVASYSHTNISKSKGKRQVSTSYNLKSHSMQFISLGKIEFWSIIKSPAFIIIALLALVNTGIGISTADLRYGNGNFPVSYLIIEGIDGALDFFIIALIAYYSGVMVWRDRAMKMNEIIDASPFPSWVSVLSKFLGLVGIVTLILVIAALLGMVMQASMGYFHFELDLYFKQHIIIGISKYAVLIAGALLIQVLVNNMYLGFTTFFVFLILNNYGWAALDIHSNLIIFNGKPSFVYSDLNKFLPWTKGLIWYNIYWLLFGLMLLFVSILFYVRGYHQGIKQRLLFALRHKNRKFTILFCGLFFIWFGTAGFLYYNAEVINTNQNYAEADLEVVDYEKKYKKYEFISQPRIVALDHAIDIYPEEKKVLCQIQMCLKNKHEIAIDSIHFTFPQLFDVSLELRDAKLVHKDKVLDYYIYHLDKALQPGDSLNVTIQSNYIPVGIENEFPTARITQNGIFIDNEDILPTVGYLEFRELSNANKRIKYGLGERARISELKQDCIIECRNNYGSSDSDWIRLTSTISTSGKQTAIAPGSLKEQWDIDNRRYFRYECDSPVPKFYSFLSAEYEIEREKLGNIDLEVYYHKGHEYNIEKMMLAMRNAISYYSENILPYPHTQARIVEFPRFSTFAQAFPGTMPYSESIGFLADLKDVNAIDKVFYVVAHEIAHQWWGNQVIGANVQGVTMLSESFAQYAALQVMEKTYGSAMIEKLLQYEMDIYLRSRSRESRIEMPLYKVENQEYIHYQKGGIVLYAMKEYIGEQKMNKVFRKFAEKNVFKEPPYATTLDFLDELRIETPDSLHGMIDDLFTKIILYDNEIVDATYSKLESGKYEVVVDIESGKYESTGKGIENEIPMDEYVFIGVTMGGISKQSQSSGGYYQKYKLQNGLNRIQIIVDEEPYKVVVDPKHLLIDKNLDDNRKIIDK